MSIVKKWKLWAAMAVLAAAAFLHEGNMAVVRADATATVLAESAKIRSEASTSSTPIGSTTKGTKLPILKSVSASDGVWYQVTVEGNQTGYIRSDIVSVEGDVPPASDSVPAAASTVTNSNVGPSAMTMGVVTRNSVNVRKGAAATDALAGTLKKDAVVTITGETTGADGKVWYQIESETVSGFIRSDLLEASAAVASEGGENNEAEGGAETPETPAAPVDEGNYTDISNVIATKRLPEGTDLEDLQLGAEVVQGWESDRYYIIYAQTKNGTEQWYLYDAENNVYERIEALTPMSKEDIASEGSKGNLIILIVLSALVIILIGVVIYLSLQLRDYQMDYDYDDDDDEDDDEYYEDYEEGRVNSRAWKPKNFLGRDDFEDDMEDEIEDEEEEEEYRKPVRRTQAPAPRDNAVRQQSRPANGQGRSSGQGRPANGQSRPANGQDRPANGQSRPVNSQDRPSGQGRPANGQSRPGGQGRPANGQGRPSNGQGRSAGSQARPGKGQPRPAQRPMDRPARPTSYEDAEDEDFEFEFLNMSDEDYLE